MTQPYLLDTNILIRWLLPVQQKGSLRALPETIQLKNVLAPHANSFYSPISLWEIAIKSSLGKLNVDLFGMQEYLQSSPIRDLALKNIHILTVSQLPWHHRDPFDRMLIAQAKIENCTLVTSDKVMREYDISTLIVD